MGQSLRLALAACLLLPLACGFDPRDVPPPYEEGLPEPDAPLAPRLAPAAQIEPEAGAPPTAEPPAAEPPAAEPGDPAPSDEGGPPPDCLAVRVVNTGGVTLNVRPDPSTADAPIGSLPPGAVVDVLDLVTGQVVNGVATWYEIDDGSLTGFISGAYAACVDPDAPATPDAPPPPPGFLLPLQCGSSVRVTQGNDSSFSHTGGSRYAFDFGIPSNTPLMAMQAGTVVFVRQSTQPGDRCYSGGDSSCINEANYVTIDHGDGSNTLYAHINSASVRVGDRVSRGQRVALSGGTGYSTGPHAHVQRQNDCGIWWCQSIPLRFGDVPGGVPRTGDIVTSQNCP
jgi:murein DD-endopeptidase MepM/ murein hydrolase activator NlpD